MNHILKTWPEYFQKIWNGEKLFELRKNDRPYSAGDTLDLMEYIPEKEQYTRRSIRCTVTYVFKGSKVFGLHPDFCILSLSPVMHKYDTGIIAN